MATPPRAVHRIGIVSPIDDAIWLVPICWYLTLLCFAPHVDVTEDSHTNTASAFAWNSSPQYLHKLVFAYTSLCK